MSTPVDVDALAELAEWWQDTLDDLEPETVTFSLTLSRTMAERTLAAARAFLESPTALWCWAHKRHPNDGEHLGRCQVGRVRLVAERNET